VLRAEEKAWLLVNPRPADAEFTKYSFPSKNMEYLASGTPVLTTRLPGMPDEYYDHVLTIDGSSAEDVTTGLRDALALGPDELHRRGVRGKEFVLDQKNNVVQSRRIIEFAKACP
jgi:glycosyltransferase involved in cell wall biosynthesis